MKAKKKWPLIAAAIVLLVFLSGGLFYLDRVQQYQKHVAGMTVADVDFSSIPDGTYEGSADETFIRVRVRVTVKDGAVSDIALIEHENGRGKPAEAIIGEIIKRQTLNVDAVSGATNSSIIIKKAVENALRAANI